MKFGIAVLIIFYGVLSQACIVSFDGKQVDCGGKAPICRTSLDGQNVACAGGRTR